MAVFGNNTSKETKKDITELSNAETRIGKGAILDGNIETYGPVRLDGKIVGNIKSKSRVVLGETSSLQGSILAQNAEISGEVKGLIEIVDLLTLKSTAVINGDIVCNKLIVEAGAVSNGSCKMGNMVKEIKINDNTKKNAHDSKQKQVV
ncbi:cell shape determination protein CcmA [marine bacterium AO1-C]|nr:cell shape determination protein CcmA [marine bacterium AO1-C]